MFWTTLQGPLRPQAPAVHHRAGRRAGRRVHGRHARAHRHRQPDVRRPLRRRLRRRPTPSSAAEAVSRAPRTPGSSGPGRRRAASHDVRRRRRRRRGRGRRVRLRPADRPGRRSTRQPGQRGPDARGQLVRRRPLNPPGSSPGGRPERRRRGRHRRQERRRSPGSWPSATPRRCSCRPAAGAGDGQSASSTFGDAGQPRRRDHRRCSTTSVAQQLRRPSRASSTASRSSPTPGVSQQRAGRPAGPGPAGRRGGRHRGDRHQGEPGRRRARRWRSSPTFMLSLRGRRAAGRRVHDLQHVLDHGRPAHPAERAAPGAGRDASARCWPRS